ncbi:MAG: PilT/PilU family type 4a pilus ATPase [Betaproteobacteria bacterium]|nr:PilT/PilU family type 4a pilus ATPase [Betaproteobacteria bacterium]MDE2048682.1 PilT/PilU family type 4a pilus ATPase [Betaproteobacteria bacterium]
MSSSGSMMERLLRLMADKKASDIYLSAGAPASIRINGQTIPINQQALEPNAPLALLSEVVPARRIEELQDTGELNMALPVSGLGSFRISAFRQRSTYAVVVRFIPFEIPALNTLNVPDVLADIVMQKRGLILMVGATGSGKSTSIASMLDHRNATTPGHIITIEDPIEYMFRSKKAVVNQREVGSDTAHMHVALKNALRQAPDCIFIGEIRDRETMTAAISYAQSGHLCLSTLHANNSYQALNRILSMYPLESRPALLSDLASGLKAVISQRLLRGKTGARLPAVEIMLNTKLTAELIDKGDLSGVKEAMEKSLAEGSQTFEEDISRLIFEGKISREEGLANADSPTNLLWRLQNDFAAKPKAAPVPEADEEPSFTEITLDVEAT